MPTVLWWGRTERDYSRNRIVLKLFEELGWKNDFFHPFSSHLGLVEAAFRSPARPDLIWLPCFRHRDIHSAAFMARKWQVPLVLDPLISAYEKEVFEREKWTPGSKQAEKIRQWETRCFATGDVVVADTAAHAGFFHEHLGVKPENSMVLPVGAEAGLFEPRPYPPRSAPYELLFYGSFLELHGVDVIVQAAKILDRPDTSWVLLGEGDMKKRILNDSEIHPNIRLESWIPYEKLPDRIARAHILLGIFGATVLTNLVIPNKMFQSMAMGRPVITSYSKAYEGTLEGHDTIGWVPSGDAPALADKVQEWLQKPGALAQRGQNTRELFDTYFNQTKMREALAAIVDQAQNSFKRKVNEKAT